MKKIITLVMATVLAAALSACGGDSGSVGNNYAEVTTTTAGKQTVSNITIVMGDWVGTYSGEVDKDGYLDGQGTWVSDYMSDFPDFAVSVNGLWKNGNIYNGTMECFYKNNSMGKASIIAGEINEDDFTAIDNNIANAKSQEDWDNTVDDIREFGGYIKDIGDFVDWALS